MENKKLNTTWVFDEEVLDSTDPDAVHADIYDISINLTEHPTELGLNGGKILTLIIKKNSKPFYVYDNGKVELDDPLYSGIILKIVCDKYNHEDAEYYLNKLTEIGVNDISLELVETAMFTSDIPKCILSNLKGFIMNSINENALFDENMGLLVKFNYNNHQYLLHTRSPINRDYNKDNIKFSLYGVREILEDKNKEN